MSLVRRNIPLDLKPYRTRFFTRGHVERILHESGIMDKCPTLVVRPNRYALLPLRVKWLRVPFAQQVNDWIDRRRPPGWLERFVTPGYVLSSDIPGG